MTWTTQKPTKPGRYELSLEPGKRKGIYPFPRYILADVAKVTEWMLGEPNAHKMDRSEVVVAVKYVNGGCWNRLSDSWFDGALWREYQEPADPFENLDPAHRPALAPVSRARTLSQPTESS